jgi:hypothetical protein
LIPNIFVSSAIEDLHHLRDAVRDTVRDVGYNPVMSEYGDVGYLPSSSAEDACYIALRDCQIAVILIGKRYGSISANNFSVTQNEARTAKTLTVPLLTLIDQEVLTFKRVFDANSANPEAKFPGMDNPGKTFAFIQEILDSPLNNGILPFSNVTSAREHLKRQLAHLFGDLLRNRFDPLKVQIRDVLSEIATLRHELTGEKGTNPAIFLRATRYLLDDDRKDYKELAEHICGSLDSAIPILLGCKSFDEFVEKSGAHLEIIEEKPDTYKLFHEAKLFSFTERVVDRDPDDKTYPNAFWGFLYGKKLIMNTKAKRRFMHIHEGLRRAANS